MQHPRSQSHPVLSLVGKVVLVLALVLPLPFSIGCDGGGAPEPFNKGGFCSRIGTPVCDRYVTCNQILDAERQDCLGAFQNGCCRDDDSCDEMLNNANAQPEVERFIVACAGALPAWSCDRLNEAKLPSQCTQAAATAPLLISRPRPAISSASAEPTLESDVRERSRRLGRIAATMH